MRGVDPDHKICNPHKIIKVGINLEEKRGRKSKLDYIRVFMSQSLKEEPQKMHAWFVFLSQKSDQMANHEIKLSHICHLMVD